MIPNDIMNIVQILTLVALVVYVIKTWEMASATRNYAKTSENTLLEMRDARDQEIAPYVIAYFEVKPSEDSVEFVIKNNGKSMATDIEIIFDPRFKAPPSLSGAPTSEQLMKKLLPEGKIPSLPPNHEIRTIISSFHDYLKDMHFRDGSPRRYKISVTYHGGIIDKTRSAEYISDIGMYEGVSFTPKRQ